MFCKNCGAQMKDEARFCPNCGTSVGAAENPQQDNENAYQSEANHSYKTSNSAPVQPVKQPKKWNDKYTVLVLVGVFAAAIALGFGVKAVLKSKAPENEALYSASDDYGQDTDSASYDYYEEDSDTYDSDDTDDTDGTDGTETNETAYDPEEGGIHRYSYILEDCTWTQAFYRAQEQGGYLVRINSREEYDYITNEIERMGYEKKQWLIGAGRDSSSTSYHWINEAGNTYGDDLNGSGYWASSEWLSGEPSYYSDGVDEMYVEIFYSSSAGRWVWNDCANDVIGVVASYSGKIGYIIEYED